MECKFCRLNMGDMGIAEAADASSLRSAEAIVLESLETAQKFWKGFWLNFTIPLLLARAAQRLGEYSRAMSWLRETLNLFQSFGKKAYENPLYEIGQCLLVLAETAVYLDGAVFGAKLLGALDGLRDSWDRIRIVPADFQRVTLAVQAALGEDNFSHQYTAGRGMTLQQAVALALDASNESM